MKTVLALILSVVLSATICGEVIKNVEYQLPDHGQEWEIVNTLNSENSGGTTIIYAPKNSQGSDSIEFFGVNSNKFPSDPADIDSFKAAITKLFPSLNIDVKILEKSDESALVEWTANEGGKQVIYGITRVFGNRNGTISLNYTTADMKNLEKSRPQWHQVLKNAKVREIVIEQKS
jgi:hypothetical protein